MPALFISQGIQGAEGLEAEVITWWLQEYKPELVFIQKVPSQEGQFFLSTKPMSPEEAEESYQAWQE